MGGQGGNAGSAGGYDKYMKQYAGSNSKYMIQANAGSSPAATLLVQQNSKSKDDAQDGGASKVVSLDSLRKRAERLEKKFEDDKSREVARVADNSARAAARVADDKA